MGERDLEHLFVYGTLRRNTRSEVNRQLERLAKFVGDAVFQGRLFLVADYPGAVPSPHAEDRVLGEVYRLIDARRVFELLDAYEECGPGFPEPAEHVRRKAPVQLKDGRQLEAWIYLYNRPTERLRRIDSGDFLTKLPPDNPQQ
jgi:gamma-glutamylcyclotransferase (GGCT)/AIG2-like uncharacterized protein YtfP